MREINIGIAVLALLVLLGSSAFRPSPPISPSENSAIKGEGNLFGDVYDPRRNLPIEGAQLILYDLSDAPIAQTETDADGAYSIDGLDAGSYRLFVDHSRFISTSYWFSIDDGQNIQVPLIRLVPEPIIEAGSASGHIRDVLTGWDIDGVSIQIKPGMNPPAAAPSVENTTTNPAGSGSTYAVNLDAGVYTLYAEKAGYRDEHFYIYVLGGDEVGEQNGILSPQLDPGEMRIVLTWGLVPADLDSHLWAPNPFGYPKVHLYFEIIDVHPWGAYFELDLDDINSFGPETTTIHAWEPETYCFFVHDFTNRENTDSRQMSNSGARVTVITANETFFFDITPNQRANVWGVFTIDGASGSISPLNTYAAEDLDASMVGVECAGM